MPLEPLTLVLLALAAFVAGVIDAMAGGGGLITLPALLAAGLPPHLALGTNKGQSVFGACTALLRYARGGFVDRRKAWVTFPAGFVGAWVGAALVLLVHPTVLRPLVLVLLVFAGALLATRKRPDVGPRVHSPRAAMSWALAIALGLGTYDGFFGPGTGTLLALAFMTVFGTHLVGATADAKVVNFASNVAAVLLFSWRDSVLWTVALPMAGAQLVGGYVGAHLAVRGGERRVRLVLFGVLTGLVLKVGGDLIQISS